MQIDTATTMYYQTDKNLKVWQHQVLLWTQEKPYLTAGGGVNWYNCFGKQFCTAFLYSCTVTYPKIHQLHL